MRHHLGDIHLPDQVGKMQGAVLLGPAGGGRELAGQQRGRVGGDQAVRREVLRQLPIGRDLDFRGLGDGLDNQVGLRRGSGHVGGEAEPAPGSLQVGRAGAQVSQVDIRITLLVGATLLQALFIEVVDHHLLALEGAVPGDLAPQHPGAQQG